MSELVFKGENGSVGNIVNPIPGRPLASPRGQPPDDMFSPHNANHAPQKSWGESVARRQVVFEGRESYFLM